MKVAVLLESRRQNWHALEKLCVMMESRHSISAPIVSRFATLYRAVCADLALADSYQLPPSTVNYLHNLVGRAHNQLYRSRRFMIKKWMSELFITIPRVLFHDRYLRIAAILFWGLFLVAMYLSTAASPYMDENGVNQFSDNVIGPQRKSQMEQMHSRRDDERGFSEGAAYTGFYIHHNAGIGLRVFAMGLLLGVGGIYETASNAILLGSVFGHMTTVANPTPFFTFVTAHGPFELTAIVLSAAAGMRLGFSVVSTGGRSRMSSLTKAARTALPVAMIAAMLFSMAALIEAFVSPSSLPYAVKAGVSVLSSGMLATYFVMLGYSREEPQIEQG